MARAGVLRYRDTEGQEWAELVPPETLGDDASLATLRGATVTDLHPPGLVTADTYREVAVGHVHDDARVESGYLVATLTVNDAAECARIRAGERRDTSAGYECDLDETPGVFEGESYQRVQRNRRYNHVGLGPSGWGRAGSDVGLRLDGGAVAVRVDAPAGDPTMKKIKIRGVEYRLDGEDKALDDKKIAAAQDAVDSMEKKADADGAELAAVKDALMKALQTVAGLEAKMAAASAATPAPVTEDMVPEEIQDSICVKRGALRESAAKVLGADVKLDGLKADEIRRKVVAKALPTVKLDGLSADTVLGMYEAVTATAATRNDGLAAANAAANGRDPKNPAEVKTDGDEDPAAALRRRTYERSHAPLTSNGKV